MTESNHAQNTKHGTPPERATDTPAKRDHTPAAPLRGLSLCCGSSLLSCFQWVRSFLLGRLVMVWGRCPVQGGNAFVLGGVCHA